MALVVLSVDLDGGSEKNGLLEGLDRSVVENVTGSGSIHRPSRPRQLCGRASGCHHQLGTVGNAAGFRNAANNVPAAAT